MFAAVLLASSLAVLAIVGWERHGESAIARPPSRLDVPASVTPTPTVPGNDSASIQAGENRLLAQNGAWSVFINAVRSGNVADLIASLDFRQHECTANQARDGNAPRCGDLGLPDGTSVGMFPEDTRGAVPLDKAHESGLWFRDAEEMTNLLSSALVNRQPRLDLIASPGGAGLIVSFAIEPVVLRAGGPTVVSISFRIDDPRAPRVQAFALGVASTTPFESLRGRERAGEKVEYWGISDELRARDAAIHAERYDSPAAKATPVGP